MQLLKINYQLKKNNYKEIKIKIYTFIEYQFPLIN